MDRFGQLFLAQAVTSMRDLKNIVGHGLWVLVILCYAYVVVLIIVALLRDHVDGSWKYTLARGIAVTGVATILLAIFFPGQSVIRARLTRPKKAEMRSTLKCELKTHSGVLPQLRTLEARHDWDRFAARDQAGFQHGRGESPAPARDRRIQQLISSTF